MENVNVRMPTHVKEVLTEQAKSEDRSLSNYLLRVVMVHYDKLNEKDRNK